MKNIILFAACASITACSAHLPTTQISDLDQVRAAIQTSKDAGAEKCAPKSQAKAVAAMYQAAHEITDEAGYHPEEDADLIASALKYALQARDEAKINCAKPKPMIVIKPKLVVHQVKPKPMLMMKPEPVVKVPVKPVILEVIALKGVYFASNSADLTNASNASLNHAVTVLQKRPNIQIEIAAYTDSRGKNTYNLALSKLRAHSVMNYFTSHGIKASRLTSEGYGEINPIADNVTREGRAKNRRVELHVLK